MQEVSAAPAATPASRVRDYGLSFDAPLPESADFVGTCPDASAVLTIFRFKFGMLWTLAGCCAAGIVLFSLGVLR